MCVVCSIMTQTGHPPISPTTPLIRDQKCGEQYSKQKPGIWSFLDSKDQKKKNKNKRTRHADLIKVHRCAGCTWLFLIWLLAHGNHYQARKHMLGNWQLYFHCRLECFGKKDQMLNFLFSGWVVYHCTPLNLLKEMKQDEESPGKWSNSRKCLPAAPTSRGAEDKAYVQLLAFSPKGLGSCHPSPGFPALHQGPSPKPPSLFLPWEDLQWNRSQVWLNWNNLY